MMARYSLMQRVTWALTGSATLVVGVLCAVFYLSFGQMEDDLVNAVLVTEAEQVLGQLKQGHDMPIQQSQTELGELLQTWLIDGQDDEEMLHEPLRGLGLVAHAIKPPGQTWHGMALQSTTGITYLRIAAHTH